MSALSALTREELQKCQDAFRQFDIDHSGSIDTAELRDTLNVMGHHVTEEECFLMMSQVDENVNGTLDFQEFLDMFVQMKKHELQRGSDADTLQAFTALGGNEDKTGEVAISRLASVIEIFDLNVKASDLIEQYDTDRSGMIDYTEFKAWIGSATDPC